MSSQQKGKLRWEIGHPVIIELIEATDPSLCRFGYKVGDSWLVNGWETSGLCGFAFHSFFPYIISLQGGGEAPWKESDKDCFIRACPDLRPGYRWLIKKG